MNYTLGHVDPWWDHSFKQLDYKYLPMSNQDDVDLWVKQGYDKLNLNGAVYGMDRPMPECAQGFLNMFNWDNIGISFYRMNTCDALPLHKDHYTKYRQLFDIVDLSVITRAIVFLEDWKSGHYFEIDSSPIVGWHAGDYVIWTQDVQHYAGNFGVEPRYTMQITGMKK